jgi:hypothetical protein
MLDAPATALALPTDVDISSASSEKTFDRNVQRAVFNKPM